MVMFKAKVIDAGRITIPKEIRDKLELKEDDEVIIVDIAKIQKNPKAKEV